MRFWGIILLTLSYLGPVWGHAPKVAICQIVEHHALNQMRDGIQNALEGYKVSWTFENAQGSATVASQVAQKVVGEKQDLIIALATPMAQALASMNTETPLLFGAVTDPVAAKLLRSPKSAESHITGVTDAVPLTNVFDLMQAVVPQAQKIGVIYNPGEANSVLQVEAMEQLAQERGLTIVQATAAKSSEVLTAMKSLIGGVDVILLPTDNTVISALEAITNPAIKNNIPVIGIDVDTVRRGAVVALGVDWYSLGQQLGGMAGSILKGKAPHEIPVQSPEKLYLHINKGTAEKIGLHLNDALLEKADKIYDK